MFLLHDDYIIYYRTSCYQFSLPVHYEKKKLQGAVFKVTAGENIYKADGTLVYKKGAEVKSNLVTGKDGKVVLSDLYLGTYVVTETKSIEGFTINTKP